MIYTALMLLVAILPSAADVYVDMSHLPFDRMCGGCNPNSWQFANGYWLWWNGDRYSYVWRGGAAVAITPAELLALLAEKHSGAVRPARPNRPPAIKQ